MRRYHRINAWASVPLIVMLVGIVSVPGLGPDKLVVAMVPIAAFAIPYAVYAWLRSRQMQRRLSTLEGMKASFDAG